LKTGLKRYSTWKKVKVEQSVETQNLLNPAFCGLIVANIIDSYNSKAKQHIPFYLLYPLTTMVLHKNTRIRIPSRASAKIHTWIQENEQIKIGLAERSKSMVPFISDSILFMAEQDVISGHDNIGLVIKNKRTLNKINKMSDFMAGYSVSSKVIGAISGNFNGPISLMAILGLRL